MKSAKTISRVCLSVTGTNWREFKMYKNENWREFKRKKWLMFIDTVLDRIQWWNKEILSSQTQEFGIRLCFMQDNRSRCERKAKVTPEHKLFRRLFAYLVQ